MQMSILQSERLKGLDLQEECQLRPLNLMCMENINKAIWISEMAMAGLSKQKKASQAQLHCSIFSVGHIS